MKRRTHDEFISEMKEMSPTIEILSRFKTVEDKVHCKCLVCNNEWDVRPRALLSGAGCPECGHKKNWDSRGRVTTEDAKRKIESVQPHLLVTGKYNGSHSNIKCYCKIHDIEFESYFCNLYNMSSTCPECAIEHARYACNYSPDEVNNKLHITHPHIDLIGKYTNVNTETDFYCNIHDKYFKATARELFNKKIRGCPQCCMSIGEYKMLTILNQFGLDIDPQHVFDDCKFINVLRFDGYCKDYNVAFEYQGEQHYKPVEFNGCGKEKSEQEFIKNQEKDLIKKKYCNNNNIKLVCVPYWEFDNMGQFLKNELKDILEQ